MNRSEKTKALCSAVPLDRKVRLVLRMSEYPIEWPLEPNMWKCWVVGKLKKAGVPVKGTLVFKGIESGTLTSFDDPTDFDATIWEWMPNIKLTGAGLSRPCRAACYRA